jgi:NAD(P)-dependent dehydrogenase (short-subunit alcohol dehydrogenase family)
METGNALIVEVTDGDAFWYRGNLYYDLAKIGVIRLAFAQAFELRNRGVTALAVTPGFLRSEAVLDHFGVTEANWTDAIARDASFAQSETPSFVGRAIAALAADPDVNRYAGQVLASWRLAREYGFTDVDGNRPDWGAYFAAAFDTPDIAADDAFYAYWHGGPMYTVFADWP